MNNILFMRKKNTRKKPLPFVSICTPTFNRRPFFPTLIKAFEDQKYPKDRMEWIIIDDGTDPIEDLVIDIPQVKYHRYHEKLSLGKKRNIMHEFSTGSILVYMDDDDYYPPERVSHAVSMLQQHPRAMCAGASEMYIYFKHIHEMYKFGPYGPKHATAATFAFRRELLNDTRYNDSAALAEEKEFLKDYTIPFVQLEPKKTILVFSHIHNTFDKRKLLENLNPTFVSKSDRTVNDFIDNKHILKFFMEDIDDHLKDYSPGLPSMKPDVLEQIKKLTEERLKSNMSVVSPKQKNSEPPTRITMQQQGKPSRELNNDEVLQLLQTQHKKIGELTELLNEAYTEIDTLRSK
jgi:glycosyltransferase involved in cell wall biosynthesis